MKVTFELADLGTDHKGFSMLYQSSQTFGCLCN